MFKLTNNNSGIGKKHKVEFNPRPRDLHKPALVT